MEVWVLRSVRERGLRRLVPLDVDAVVGEQDVAGIDA